MNKKSFRILVWVTSVCMITILTLQTYWLYITFMQERKNFSDLVQIARQEIDKKIWNFFSEDYNVGIDAESILSLDSSNLPRPVKASKLRGYYSFGQDSIPVYETNFQHDTITRQQLDSIILEVITGLGLPRDYRIDYTSESLSVFSPPQLPSIGSSNVLAPQPITLPNPGGNNEPSRLYILFPNTIGHSFMRMGWLIFFNFILLLVVVGLFIYAFRTILKQKRIEHIRKDFINNLSHEYRTPVASVSLALDGLINYSDNLDQNKQKSYLDMARKENRRLGLMIERTLQLASYESGSLNVKMTKISLHELIKEVVANFEVHVQSRQGKIVVDLNARIDQIWGDPDHILQCLYNLLDNAAKYSLDLLDIAIETENIPNDLIVIKVIDQGIGIPSRKQKHIFKAYQRADNASSSVKGFGIGLAYVKQIVELHQGSIVVNSNPGDGSTFIITLPLSDDKH